MIARRTLLKAAAIGVAAPFIIRSPLRAANVRVRRDVMELPDNDPFFRKYGDAVRAMHNLPQTDGRSWMRQAQIHADFCKHSTMAFLHWHRHYLTFFEAICGELIGDPDFALPYWNWSKKGGVIPPPFYDVQELNVEFWKDPGVYNGAAWGPIDTVGRRGLAKGQGLLADPVRGGSFTSARIDSIKNLPNAGLFRSGLEGSPHNDGHVVSGATATGRRGHIGSGLSPLDPIFWLHHCMVDRVWAEWQKTHATPDPGETYSNNFVDRKGTAVTVASGAAATIGPLGYTYDVLQPSPIAAPATGALLNTIVPELEKALAAPPVLNSLGSASNAEASMALIETAIKVSTPKLAEALAGDRAFRRFSQGREVIGVEPNRTLAVLSNVQLKPGQGDLLVNVFVNCPYLSPNTGYVDPHYAGTFSFFGMGAHAGHDGSEFVIDITAPVRSLANEGRIKDNQLTIQLMPVPAYMDAKTDTSFRAGKVDIIAF
jgi:tyrosinase